MLANSSSLEERPSNSAGDPFYCDADPLQALSRRLCECLFNETGSASVLVVFVATDRTPGSVILNNLNHCSLDL